MIFAATIAGAFLITLLIGAFTRLHPAACAVVLPVLAAAGALAAIALWPTGSSTDAIAVPMVFLFALMGSVPGAVSGALIRRQRVPPPRP